MKTFTTSFNGYNKSEVQAFVNEVTTKYKDLFMAYKKLNEELEQKGKELARYTGLENSLNQAIMVAEETTSQMKRMARDEGKVIVEDAKKNASRIINDALIKADQIENDAIILKRKIASYKARIRAIMEEQMKMIDDMEEFNTRY